MRLALGMIMVTTGVLVVSPPAVAGPPAASMSWVDPCIVVCPAADSTLLVVANEITGTPQDFPFVELLLSGCPGFQFGPLTGSEPYAYDLSQRRIYGSGDVFGTVSWLVRGGGTCAAASVQVRADGVLLADRGIASFDQNGDLVVDSADRQIVSAKIGTADATADFDCDGQVTAIDLGILDTHDGHSSYQPVPVDRASWGRVKIFYH